MQPQCLGVLSCPGQRAAPNTLLVNMQVSGCTDADRRRSSRDRVRDRVRAHACWNAGTSAWSSGTTGLRTKLLYRTTWTCVVCTRTLITLEAGEACRPVVTPRLDMHMQHCLLLLRRLLLCGCGTGRQPPGDDHAAWAAQSSAEAGDVEQAHSRVKGSLADRHRVCGRPRPRSQLLRPGCAQLSGRAAQLAAGHIRPQ